MDEKVLRLLEERICSEADSMYIINVADKRIEYVNEKMKKLFGTEIAGFTCDEIVTRNPHLREFFSCSSDFEWEYYDAANKRLYKLRRTVIDEYAAVIADNITDVLNLNYEVTDYLRLMNSLSEMQAELIKNQNNTLEILMRTLIKQFSAQAVYVSYRLRGGTIMLCSLLDINGDVIYEAVDKLPEHVIAIEPTKIDAVGVEYEFRVFYPKPPELWDANYAIVMNIAGVYLESAVLREQIEWDNAHDKFTGLYNRAYFINALSKRYSALDTIGIVFLDLDNLKKTNDEQGHSAGDALIKKAADTLLLLSTENTDAYRMGGDEFMLVMCNCTEEAVDNVVLRLRRIVDKSNIDVPYPQLLMSVGCAYSSDVENIEALINLADSRMYEEKLRHKMIKQ